MELTQLRHTMDKCGNTSRCVAARLYGTSQEFEHTFPFTWMSTSVSKLLTGSVFKIILSQEEKEKNPALYGNVERFIIFKKVFWNLGKWHLTKRIRILKGSHIPGLKLPSAWLPWKTLQGISTSPLLYTRCLKVPFPIQTLLGGKKRFD